MKIQALLVEGPHDGRLFTVQDDHVPNIIRTAFGGGPAWGPEEPGATVLTFFYRLVGSDNVGPLMVAGYEFTHQNEAKATLVDYWLE